MDKVTDMLGLLLNLLNVDKCFEIFRSYRWPEYIYCPDCKSQHIYFDFEESPKNQYKCAKCGRWWTDYTGTIFEGTKVPIEKWFLVMIFFSKKTSAKEMSEMFDLNRKTVNRMVKLIMNDVLLRKFSKKLSEEAEADEVYVNIGEKGSKNLNFPRKRGRKKPGRGTFDSGRAPILGLVERQSGKIKLEVAFNAKKETCHDFIHDNLMNNSILYTDSWVGYKDIDWLDGHKTVNHSKKEYARDEDHDGKCEVHCNTMEGIWSVLRQFLRTFRGLTKKYVHLYVSFFEFLYNNKRDSSDALEDLLFLTLATHD